MYEYFSGKITQINPAFVVIETGGIGYLIQISLQTFTAIGSAEQVKLYVHHIQREDAQILFGFYTPQEREMFRLLISVSGIGANTARVILSSYGADELVNIIATGNVAALKGVKGIGAKTAERVIVDLKSKVLNVGIVSDGAGAGEVFSQLGGKMEESVAALTILGYTRASCEKIVKSICQENAQVSSEDIIRQALTKL